MDTSAARDGSGWVDVTEHFTKFDWGSSRDEEEVVRFGDMVKGAELGLFSNELAAGVAPKDFDAIDLFNAEFAANDSTPFRWTYDKTKPVSAQNRQAKFRANWNMMIPFGGAAGALIQKDPTMRVVTPISVSSDGVTWIEYGGG